MTKLVRGAVPLPNRSPLPVLSKAGESILATDAAGALFKSSNGGPYLPVGAGSGLAAPVSLELAVDFAAVITAPTYAVLFTLPITTLLPASYIKFTFTCNWTHSGGFAGNAAFNARFLLNGAPLPGGTTDNKVRSQIGCVARVRRVVVTAATNPQTVVVEISKFGAVGNTLSILPASLPDLMHASLVLEEQL